MATTLTVSLPEYVEQSHDKLLRDAVLGAETAKRFTLQTGVKTKTALNLLNTEVELQDGSSCGFSANGSTTISQRTITAPVVKVNMEWCEKQLLNTCLQHNVRIAAGQKTLPFEQDFIAQVIEQVNLKCENLIWQGDTSKTSDVNLKWTDGILKLLKAQDGITIASQKLEHQALTLQNVGMAVQDVVLAIPTEVLNRATIYMGYDTYRLWVMSWQIANMFHFDGGQLDVNLNVYPGSQIPVKPVPGLNGTSEIVAGVDSNFYYGTDLQGDEERFDFWYSKDDQKFKLAIEFGIGTQIAFPNRVVISSLAESSSSSSSSSSSE